MTPNLELDFGGAKIRALFGKHVNQHKILKDLTEGVLKNPIIDTPEMRECAFYGYLEYRNYLFTLPNGVKILLWGGYPTREQFALYSKLKPDVAIIQRSTDPKDIARKARFAAELGAKIVIPHHHDFREVDPPEVAAALDLFEQEYLALVPDGRFIKPVHGEWIDL
jgi:hypothetical protein